ncbi:hypothetical protein OIU34_23000 [Pararhizobium sp. BT-229]|uniref:hypothetical protein n=1 Tax=Pararhizobium sp. BT-229 TaxID=2986923 RepID=UPI0021F6C2C3|nr:hypothetical protein [Pararhizobium sp. BT-229]MCV9964763.1 hypothetical protein [Pararhizobium sp. BT-229]
MLIELPFISQIVALMPRDKTPSSAIVRDSGVFEIQEADPDEFLLAAIRTQRTGNRGPSSIYWKDGDFWCYFWGGVGGVDAKEAQLSRFDSFAWHWFASIIGPENFLFSHYPSGSFVGFHGDEPMPQQKRIVENFREHVLAGMRPMIADNLRVVGGALMVKVAEPGYQLWIHNRETKKNPLIRVSPLQGWLEPKTSRRLDMGHMFPALDWEGFVSAQRSFRRIAPDAVFSEDALQFDVRLPEAFNAGPASVDYLAYSARSLAQQAYRGMFARTIPENCKADVGRLYELFEHQAHQQGVTDRIVNVMSRVVRLADLEDRLAWELFLERYDEAPIALAI